MIMLSETQVLEMLPIIRFASSVELQAIQVGANALPNLYMQINDLKICLQEYHVDCSMPQLIPCSVSLVKYLIVVLLHE